MVKLVSLGWFFTSGSEVNEFGLVVYFISDKLNHKKMVKQVSLGRILTSGQWERIQEDSEAKIISES